jgi:lauroyl/myristoyl acyltransferase
LPSTAPQTTARGPGFRALRALAAAAIFLPARLPLGVLAALGSAAGALGYLALPRRRRIARVNVERAQDAGFLPAGLDAGRVARLSFATVARTLL